jgi:hypothetical protein
MGRSGIGLRLLWLAQRMCVYSPASAVSMSRWTWSAVLSMMTMAPSMSSTDAVSSAFDVTCQ